ncbi:hypothetical protein [Microbacterium sp. 22242]|uniref:hypothetical protein n=1 Tax=Microbacterium sp. 22242 TaxID=3453896 RepID=UPI003F86C1E0
MLADEWADEFFAQAGRRCGHWKALQKLRREQQDLVPADELARRAYDEETQRLLAEIHATGVAA